MFGPDRDHARSVDFIEEHMFFIGLSSEVLSNRDFVLAAVDRSVHALEFASDELKNDREVVLAVLSRCGMVLMDASNELKNDPEIVLFAVEMDGRAMEFASDRLKNDRDFVLSAVSTGIGLALEHVADKFKNDREVVLAAIHRCGISLQYAADEFKSNREIALLAVRDEGWAMEYAADELKNDKAFVLAAVGCNGWALEYVSDKFRNDPSVVCRSVGACFVHFCPSWIGEELRSKLALALDRLKVDCGYIACPGALLNNADILSYANQCEKTLWENIWLLLSRAPAAVGCQKPFAGEIGKYILEFAGVQEEVCLLNTLKFCAPVIGAFAKRGVALEDIDLDQPVSLPPRENRWDF